MDNNDYVFVVFRKELDDDFVAKYFASVGLRITLIYIGDSGVQGVECDKGDVGGLERISALLDSGKLNGLVLKIFDGNECIDINNVKKSLGRISKELREGMDVWNYSLKKPNILETPIPKLEMKSIYDPENGTYYTYFEEN